MVDKNPESGIHSEVPNQEVVSSIPMASSTVVGRFFIWGGHFNGFFLPNLSIFYEHSTNLAPPSPR